MSSISKMNGLSWIVPGGGSAESRHRRRASARSDDRTGTTITRNPADPSSTVAINRRCKWFVTAVAITLVAVCGTPAFAHDLLVDMVTDFSFPGDFDRIVVTVKSGDSTGSTILVRTFDPRHGMRFDLGVRILRAELPDGRLWFNFELMKAGGVLTNRPASVDLRSDAGFTIVITRRPPTYVDSPVSQVVAVMTAGRRGPRDAGRLELSLVNTEGQELLIPLRGWKTSDILGTAESSTGIADVALGGIALSPLSPLTGNWKPANIQYFRLTHHDPGSVEWDIGSIWIRALTADGSIVDLYRDGPSGDFGQQVNRRNPHWGHALGRLWGWQYAESRWNISPHSRAQVFMTFDAGADDLRGSAVIEIELVTGDVLWDVLDRMDAHESRIVEIQLPPGYRPEHIHRARLSMRAPGDTWRVDRWSVHVQEAGSTLQVRLYELEHFELSDLGGIESDVVNPKRVIDFATDRFLLYLGTGEDDLRDTEPAPELLVALQMSDGREIPLWVPSIDKLESWSNVMIEAVTEDRERVLISDVLGYRIDIVPRGSGTTWPDYYRDPEAGTDQGIPDSKPGPDGWDLANTWLAAAPVNWAHPFAVPLETEAWTYGPSYALTDIVPGSRPPVVYFQERGNVLAPGWTRLGTVLNANLHLGAGAELCDCPAKIPPIEYFEPKDAELCDCPLQTPPIEYSEPAVAVLSVEEQVQLIEQDVTEPPGGVEAQEQSFGPFEGPGGHYYEVVLGQPLTWKEANIEAEAHEFSGRSGHLATITSREEDEFIEELRQLALAEIGIEPFDPDLQGAELWVGGLQEPDQDKVDQEWFWVNGEGRVPGPFEAGYSNWLPGEPNDRGATPGVEDNEENYLSIGLFGQFGWNDEGLHPDDSAVRLPVGYVVEYDLGLPAAGPGVRVERVVGAELAEPRLAVRRVISYHYDPDADPDQSAETEDEPPDIYVIDSDPDSKDDKEFGPFLSGTTIAFDLTGGRNLDGLHGFRRGDCNDDAAVDVSDPLATLLSIFLGEFDVTCEDACDSNDDGTVDVSDPITTLGVLFLGNGVIPFPGRKACGVDPTEDELDCETPPQTCVDEGFAVLPIIGFPLVTALDRDGTMSTPIGIDLHPPPGVQPLLSCGEEIPKEELVVSEARSGAFSPPVWNSGPLALEGFDFKFLNGGHKLGTLQLTAHTLPEDPCQTLHTFSLSDHDWGLVPHPEGAGTIPSDPVSYFARFCDLQGKGELVSTGPHRCRGADVDIPLPRPTRSDEIAVLAGFSFQTMSNDNGVWRPGGNHNIREIKVMPEADRAFVTVSFSDDGNDDVYLASVQVIYAQRGWFDGVSRSRSGSRRTNQGTVDVLDLLASDEPGVSTGAPLLAGFAFRYSDSDHHLERISVDLGRDPPSTHAHGLGSHTHGKGRLFFGDGNNDSLCPGGIRLKCSDPWEWTVRWAHLSP